MNESIYTSIDIGSRNIKIMSISFDKNTNKTKILHKNSFKSSGVVDGYISNPDIFNQSFSLAIQKYKKETGIEIKESIITIDSLGLKSKRIKINHNVINQNNISKIDLSEIERKVNILAKKNIDGEILDHRLIKYSINNYEYFSSVEDMSAKKIEAEFIFIFLPHNHLSILEKVMTLNDISMLDIISGNVISGDVNLENEDKKLGVMNVDIGSDKTSLSIWENNKITYLNNINFGSDDITKKISLEEKISFKDAENLKKKYHENKKVEKVIKKIITDLAAKIKNILIELERDQLLPSGTVIYGGGSKNELFGEILKEVLHLPVKKYSKTISDSNTDYYNNYASITNYIKKDTDNFSLNLDKLKNSIKKLFFIKK